MSTDLKYCIVLIRRSNTEPTITITTPMTDSFSMDVAAEWNPDFAGIGEKAVSSVTDMFMGGAGQYAGAAMKAAGWVPQSKALTAQIWGGTSYIELSIPFTFKVEIDPIAELINPIKQLLSLTLPSADPTTGILKAPFAVADPKTMQDKNGGWTAPAATGLEINFGKFLTFPACIITGISKQYDCLFTQEGLPTSSKIDVHLRTMYCTTLGDVDKIFLGNGVSVSAGSI